MIRSACLALVIALSLMVIPSARAQPVTVGHVDSSLYPIRVLYTATADASDVATVLDLAESAWEAQVVGMGWPVPSTQDATGTIIPGLWIYVDPDGEYNYGMPLGDNPGTTHTDCTVAVIVSSVTMPSYLEVVVPHEVNHALQMAVDCTESGFAYENTTVAVTTLTDPTNAYFTSYFLPAFQEWPHAGLDCTYQNDQAHYYYHYGSSLFALFLEERYGDADGKLLVAIWNAAKQDGTVTVGAMGPTSSTANEPDILDAMGTVLGEQGVTFAEAFVEFARWRFFIGADDDGAHFAYGADWTGGEVARAAQHALADLPVVNAEPVEALADLGSAYVELDLAGLEEGKALTVQVRGGDLVAWHVDVLLVRADGTADVETLTIDAAGTGQAVLTGLEVYTRAVLVITNLGDADHDSDHPACTSRVMPAYELSLADATVPPVLDSVSPAELTAGEGAYLWVTGTELGAAPQVVFSGAGIHVGAVDVLDGSTLGVEVTVDATATPGPRDVTVTNDDGLSDTLTGGVTVIAADPPVDAGDGDGCGCATSRPDAGAGALLLIVLGWLWVRRRAAAVSRRGR